MKKISKNILATAVLVIAMFTSSAIYAQFPGFNDDVYDETPAAPIDGFIAIGFIAGGALAYRKLKK